MISNVLLSAMIKRQKLPVNVLLQQVWNYLSLFLLDEKVKYKEVINLC